MTDCEADLILLRGLPGSGKSTLARQMKGRVHLEADMFYARSGKYIYKPEYISTAQRWCFQETEMHLEDGEKVVVSNTFVQVWEMEPYFELAHRLGKSVEVREATGDYQNTHGVPPEKLAIMRERWEPFPNKKAAAPGNYKSKYLAFSVSPASKAALLGAFPPKYERVICGHITVDFNVTEDSYTRTLQAYRNAKLEVIGYATDGAGVEALVVSVNGSTKRPSGGTFHITLSLGAGRKPVESNQVIQTMGFESITPIAIQATLELLNK